MLSPVDTGSRLTEDVAVLSELAQASMTKFFWKECDPLLDGHMVASAMAPGSPLPAAARRGAERMTHLHEPLMKSPAKSDIEAFALECQALTLSRYASNWSSLMQMFGSQDAVLAEMHTYTARFAETLSNDLDMAWAVLGAHEAAASDFTGGLPQDQTWVDALTAFGEVWADGRAHGQAVPEMMQALWSR